MQNRNNKTIIKNLLLSVSVFLVGIFFLEIFAGYYVKKNKILEKLDNPSIGCKDKDLGWGFKPGAKGSRITSDYEVSYRINSRGLREKETPFLKPKEIFRILALGESNVFGVGVNYGSRFTEIIAGALHNAEVINMGIWGYGPDQCLLQLERDGWRYQPNAVILFAIDDFFERCHYYSNIGRLKPRFLLNDDKTDIYLQDLRQIKKSFKPLSSLREKSENEIIKFLKEFVSQSSLVTIIKYHKAIKEFGQGGRKLEEKLWKRLYVALENDHKIGVYGDTDFHKLVYFLLKRYRDTCKEHGAHFILIHIDIGKKSYAKNICNELGITYLDLAKVLMRASESFPLQFKTDPHHTAMTHKVIGEYVSDYLVKEYGIEKNPSYLYEFLGMF